ncbi:MAG: 16S rRNA (uracil(1498)-N(3))-methyltransferase [Trueperaceae bacterium]|nr:MAG: 16S rRNA (uracil(1498)-N(3))-methyltransferase [Trueperaceae bacterium]
MRTHRVYSPVLAEGLHILSGSESRHLIKVLRIRPGAKIKAFDGQGLEADGSVVRVDDPVIEVEFSKPYPSVVEAPVLITLAVALLKGDKLSEVVRRGTELGITTFQPYVCSRCQIRELSTNKMERLRRVAQEAAKQCGRSRVPVISEIVNLASLPLSSISLVADPRATATLLSLLPVSLPERLTLVTGPEGGFDPQEVSILQQRGAQLVTLGARQLRAETAPLALTSAILVPGAL